ncbi:sensor histidine kinase [Frankia sp. AgB32]|uniref:sensor histidine kinase n=1 Tax=Frankia sp. AgB32 TaxID=631119 RepID=UPI00200F6FF3|nr:sensor histidine kinase [Frankia sp. AgB32]MCK9896711.1 sensor histidine kinase [Frankia sp. AgB32]
MGTAQAGAMRRWLLTSMPTPTPTPTQGRPGMDAWRWRRVSGVFLVYLGYAVSDMFALHDSAIVIAYGGVILVAFCVLYMWALPLAVFHGRLDLRAPLLAGMTACIVAYLPVVGGGGLVMTVYLAVALTLVVAPVASIPMVLGIAAVDTWLPQHIGWWRANGPQWSLCAPVLFAALTMHVIRSGARNQAELRRANLEIERLAKEQERLRIARDLHDLLGHALTTITVKAELASKLAHRDPLRAADEMAQVAALGRQSLADVRATVAGYREVSLVTELAAARQVLAAAGIRGELPASVDEVPGGLRELFGWVLREGVTNAVRHSGASHFRVTVDGGAIEIVDDGRGPAESRRTDGAGLAGLAERVRAAGGRLEFGPAHPGSSAPGFRLRAAAPLPPTPTTRDPAGSPAATTTRGRDAAGDRDAAAGRAALLGKP